MRVNDLPDRFLWGAATSAYQVEGAIHEDGRGESIWDRFCRQPGRIRDGDTGDIACDSYHRWPEDVALAGELALDALRFSIAWPRVQPTGQGPVSPAGLDHYERFVDALLAAGIRPFATLYHWDLPQPLEDAGGWPVRGTAERFAEYAGAVAARLGDRLTAITTLNEPWCSADLGYRTGEHAPGRQDPDAALAAGHHLLVAHGLGVAAIRAAAPRLPVGIALNFEPKHPATDHPLDLEAAAIAHDRMNRWYLDPIMGLDPPAAGVRAAGWRQEEVRPDDRKLIAAPIDLLGVNLYTREVVRSASLPPLPPLPARDVERTAMGWEIHPDGLTQILGFIASRTGSLPLYVMENGASEEPGIHDPRRTRYLAQHIAAVARARADGVPVRGYFAWSLLDNFEWAHGYAHRFGLVAVDFATQARTIRDSGRWLAAIARSGSAPRLDASA